MYYNSAYASAYPTQKVDPTTNGVAHITSAAYDFNTGQVTSFTDQNGQVSSFAYDALGRIWTARYPDLQSTGNSKAFCYPSLTTLTEYTAKDQPLPAASSSSEDCSAFAGAASTSMSTTHSFDGLGRVTRTSVNESTTQSINVDTAYDAAGNVYSISNPYRPGDAILYTSTLYDALHRPLSTTKPDGINSTRSSYAGNVVDSWDENGTHTQHVTDGLSRLTKVMELGTTVDPRSLETDYSYDVLGNLKYVNQIGAYGETPRTRSFTYDSLSRLITSTNPETGTICYGVWSRRSPGAGNCTSGYDANGNLVNKTEANGVTVAYSYDQLNRITYSNASDWQNTQDQFYYDICITSPCSNPIGHLTYQNEGSNNVGTSFSYDAMGHVTNSQWMDLVNGNWNTGSSATYDLAGNITQISYPDGRVINQSYDAAGRLTAATDATPGGLGTVYFSNPQYTAAGALASATYGNGVTENIAYNSRLQPCHTFANSPALPPAAFPGGSGSGGNVYDRVSSYAANPLTANPCGAETGNNGNIGYIADFLNFDHTQSFTYDGLNRLTSAFRSDGGYNHTYKYDSFGNLIVQDNLITNPSFTINPATNQLNRWNGIINMYSYDESGNMISTGTSDIGGSNFVYNADSQIQLVSGAAFAYYAYDALGRRVFKESAPDDNYTEYVYFNGQPYAELGASFTNPNLTWTDYIYAGGQKIAKVTTLNSGRLFSTTISMTTSAPRKSSWTLPATSPGRASSPPSVWSCRMAQPPCTTSSPAKSGTPKQG